MAEFKEISPNASAGEKLLNWVDNRFPLSKMYKEHLSEYYAPKNFNFWYFFGALSLLVLVVLALIELTSQRGSDPAAQPPQSPRE
mgnify:CR=1 FL=1